MKRRVLYDVAPVKEEFFGLLVCAIFFLSGIVVGTFSAASLDEAASAALRASMSGHIDQIIAGTATEPGFWSTLWATGRVPLLILFLGFSLFGTPILPMVAGVRGFYLSFSIAVFIRAFGIAGWPLAFVLFGVGALITVPCFFLLASQAFRSSLGLGKAVLGAGKVHLGILCGPGYFGRCGLCAVLILVAVFVELYVTPALVVFASSFL
ncbi:MAG: stage II sporulation protein M [Oscillospiraceae bacterium]|nr:stage II sporulation protein M [Oscillospiraceae bacterium]